MTDTLPQPAGDPGNETTHLNRPPDFSRKAVYFGLLFEAGLVLLAILLGWLFQLSPLSTLTLDLVGLGLGVAATLPMLAGLALVIGLPIAPFQRLRRVFEEYGRPFFASYTLLDLAVLAALAGAGEELLFRGVLQAILDRWWGPWVGLLVASSLFGALHALTPTYAVLAALAGLYLGGVWLLTGNLLVAIIAHGLYDFFALVYLLRFKAAS